MARPPRPVLDDLAHDQPPATQAGPQISHPNPHRLRGPHEEVPRHADEVPRQRHPFHPQVFDSQGESATTLVSWLARRLSVTLHRTPDAINLDHAQRISSLLHRDSARAIVTCAPSSIYKHPTKRLGTRWDAPVDTWTWAFSCLPVGHPFTPPVLSASFSSRLLVHLQSLCAPAGPSTLAFLVRLLLRFEREEFSERLPVSDSVVPGGGTARRRSLAPVSSLAHGTAVAPRFGILGCHGVCSETHTRLMTETIRIPLCAARRLLDPLDGLCAPARSGRRGTLRPLTEDFVERLPTNLTDLSQGPCPRVGCGLLLSWRTGRWPRSTDLIKERVAFPVPDSAFRLVVLEHTR